MRRAKDCAIAFAFAIARLLPPHAHHPQHNSTRCISSSLPTPTPHSQHQVCSLLTHNLIAIALHDTQPPRDTQHTSSAAAADRHVRNPLVRPQSSIQSGPARQTLGVSAGTVQASGKWPSGGRFSGLLRRADAARQRSTRASAATTRVKAARTKPGRAGSLTVSRCKGDTGK